MTTLRKITASRSLIVRNAGSTRFYARAETADQHAMSQLTMRGRRLFTSTTVAIIIARWQELEHLEPQLILAVGPACHMQQLNRKTGKSEDLGPADAYGD